MGKRTAIGLALATALVALVAGCPLERERADEGPAPRTIGSRGTEPGKFSHPRSIDIAPDGRFAVGDRTGRIQILSANGAPLHSWEMPKMDNGTPTGLAFDATAPGEPTIVVADTHNSRVMRYTIDGKLIKQWGEYGENVGQMIYPTNVAIDAKGFIHVTEYGKRDKVMKFDRDGNFVKQWGDFGQKPGMFQRPLALVFAPPDKIVVADSCNHRIQTFTLDGERLSTWGEPGAGPGQLNYPYDLSIGPDGLLYVIEYGNNRVQRFTMAGKFMGLYGGPGAAPGRFGAPWGGVFAPSGALWVADTDNHRLQEIKPERFKGASE